MNYTSESSKPPNTGGASTKEVIICLERTLLARRVNPATFLARADALREQSNLPPLTDGILRKAKAEGRP
jgi:hypothetical protein